MKDEKEYIGQTNYGVDEGSKIRAFDEKDDELNLSKEDMLKELGKEGIVSEEVEGIIMTDEITGESIPSVPDDGDIDINSLQDFDLGDLSSLTTLSRELVKVITPTSYSDEKKEEIAIMIEEKIKDKRINDIERLTSDEMKELVGLDIYENVREFNKKPLSALKTILVQLKSSMVERVQIMNASEELNKAMDFFNNYPQEETQAKIFDEINADGEEYKTELHRYSEYLRRYIAFIESKDETAFTRAEVKVSSERLKAIDDAINFVYVKETFDHLKPSIFDGIKNPELVAKVIRSFIGALNSDKTMVIQFPVPKNFVPTDDPKYIEKLVATWLLFVELLVIYKDYPALKDVSHPDYYKITRFLNNVETPDVDNEADMILKAVIDENKLTAEIIARANNTAVLFTYILARLFNPKKLNDYSKYVLSYTMAIISNSMKTNYLEITHELLATTIFGLSDYISGKK